LEDVALSDILRACVGQGKNYTQCVMKLSEYVAGDQCGEGDAGLLLPAFKHVQSNVQKLLGLSDTMTRTELESRAALTKGVSWVLGGVRAFSGAMRYCLSYTGDRGVRCITVYDVLMTPSSDKLRFVYCDTVRKQTALSDFTPSLYDPELRLGGRSKQGKFHHNLAGPAIEEYRKAKDSDLLAVYHLYSALANLLRGHGSPASESGSEPDNEEDVEEPTTVDSGAIIDTEPSWSSLFLPVRPLTITFHRSKVSFDSVGRVKQITCASTSRRGSGTLSTVFGTLTFTSF
jgi:hypothetical protein